MGCDLCGATLGARGGVVVRLGNWVRSIGVGCGVGGGSMSGSSAMGTVVWTGLSEL